MVSTVVTARPSRKRTAKKPAATVVEQGVPDTRNKGGAPLGNNNASKGRPFLDQLRKIIAADDLDPKVKVKRLRQAAEQLLSQAARGEEWAIKELANRLDGRAIQGVEVTNPDGSGLNFFDAATLRGFPPEKLMQLRSLLKEAGASAASEGAA